MHLKSQLLQLVIKRCCQRFVFHKLLKEFFPHALDDNMFKTANAHAASLPSGLYPGYRNIWEQHHLPWS